MLGHKKKNLQLRERCFIKSIHLPFPSLLFKFPISFSLLYSSYLLILPFTCNIFHFPPKMPQVVPSFSNSVKLKYVKLGYQYLVNHILTFLLVPIIISVIIEALTIGPEELLNIWNSLHFDILQVLCSSFLIIFIATVYFMSKPRSTYLVDWLFMLQASSYLSCPIFDFHGAFQAHFEG